MNPADASPASTGANPDAPVPYVFGREIARGGMGSILETADCKLGRKVAVKIMLWEASASLEQQQRFINEAAVLAMLEHPNIVPIHDIGRDAEGQLYYSMKLVKGVTLQSILDDIGKKKPAALREYTLDRLLTIFRKICDALASAHSRGIIHRDLKPANIMVGEFGEVLVMDWGIAKNFRSPGAQGDFDPLQSLQPAYMSGLTLEGMVMGTPNYMSPEQASGRVADMGPRSDIFTLGGILYAILTLHPPVEGATLDEVLRKVTSGLITPPSDFGAATSTGKAKNRQVAQPAVQTKNLPHCPGGRVPTALNAVTMKALALKREDRYPNVAEFAADIEAYQTGFATTAENASAWRQMTLLIKRHKVAATSVAACLLLLAGVSAGFTSRLLDERNTAIQERERAEEERGKAVAAQLKADAERNRAEELRLQAERERTRAENESLRAQQALAEAKAQRTRADTESMRAQQAKDSLEMTAPTFFSLAKARFSEARFADALKEVDAALVLEPANVDYHLLRAGLFQLWLRLDEALKVYRHVLTLQPGHQLAQANITLCQEVTDQLQKLRAPSPKVRYRLLEACRRQQRDLDALVLEKLLQEATAKLADQLDQLDKTVVVKTKEQRVITKPDGSLRVVLNHLPVDDLTLLGDTWVTELSLCGSKISSLRGLPPGCLRELNMESTHIGGLSPLSDQPLEVLSCPSASISDLSVLGMLPLKSLSVAYNKLCRDISPLSKCEKLEYLDISGTSVSDLTPLATVRTLKHLLVNKCKITNLAPLESLHLEELVYFEGPFAEAASIAPLRNNPLQKLHLGGTWVSDLATLRGSSTLEEITLPYLFPETKAVRQLDDSPTIQSLRFFPHLKRIYVSNVYGSAVSFSGSYSEFWKAVSADTQKLNNAALADLRRVRTR